MTERQISHQLKYYIMKRPYLIMLSLLLLSSLNCIANGQRSQKVLTKPPKDTVIKTDTIDVKSNIIPPYNLFYLSKYLNNATLNPSETELIYRSLVNLVGKDKLDIIGTGSPYRLIAKFKESAINAKALFIKKLLNKKVEGKNSPALDSLSLLLGRYNEKNAEIATINAGISVMNIKKTEVNNAINFLKVYSQSTISEDSASIIKKYQDLIDPPVSTISSISQLKSLLNLRNTSLDESIEKESKKIDTTQKLVKDANKLFKEIEDNTKRLADSLLTNGTFSMDTKSYLERQLPNQQESFQINLTTIAQNAKQGLNYTGFSIPSQSQMIDAMAMFLTKRAKQEAAIWFMDQLRKRVNNPLIYDVFPATIELLKGLSDYRTANFGTSWRYAISKDFVEMPRNVSKSSWTRQFLTAQNAANLEKTVELGYNIDDLIKARYNYRDVIRQLYLNPTYSPDPNISSDHSKDTNQYAQNIIAVLYIATNELFTITDNKTYRLLSYEELKTLDKNQWKVLIELFKLKYGPVFDNLPGVKKNEIENKEKVIAWLSPLLMSLGQFDKINQEQQALIEKNKSDQTNQPFSNTWSVLGQVISNFENYPFGTSGKKGVNQYLDNIKNVFEIIENIQEKNFVAAAQNTLGLVDSYYRINPTQENIILSSLTSFLKNDSTNKNISKLQFDNNGIYFFNAKKNKVDILLNNYQREYIKQLGKNLQHIPQKEQLNFYKNIIGDSLKIISSKVSSQIDQIYLINRIALYYGAKGIQNEKDLKTILNQLSQTIPDLKESLKLAKLSEMSYADQLVKLSGFFGDVIASSSSAELANVIESHALPPTSYKLKRKMSSSVDLNAYVGAFWGKIIPFGNSLLNGKWTGGITAPIGVTIRPAGNFFKYFNLHVQLLELGNLVNHYLITPDSAYNKEVHFSEVFSPGVNILYNIKNTPIVAFIGGKLLPLKSYYDEGVKKTFNDKAFDALIISVGLKIDIPLVNLHSGE